MTIPVPTQSQRLPSRSQDTWQQVEWGGLDVALLPTIRFWLSWLSWRLLAVV